jgi:hypothetical protein
MIVPGGDPGGGGTLTAGVTTVVPALGGGLAAPVAPGASSEFDAFGGASSSVRSLR